MFRKIEKEYQRFKKRIFASGDLHVRLEQMQAQCDNLPYEIYGQVKKGECQPHLPRIKTVFETLETIIENRSSLARFGDGEFTLMQGGRIHFQDRNAELAGQLKDILASQDPNLLIAIPDCFGSLNGFIPPVRAFYRKWMPRNRENIYSFLETDRLYDNALFTRVYSLYEKTPELYKYCEEYFTRLQKIWKGRDVVICEGEGTRFGLFNDLLDEAKSVSRVLGPARNAYQKSERIRTALEEVPTESLILIALGPTATVLSSQLHSMGYQAIDIGHLDLEYEWYRRRDEQSRPIEFKYTDGTEEGRKVHPLDDEKYRNQIIAEVL